MICRLRDRCYEVQVPPQHDLLVEIVFGIARPLWPMVWRARMGSETNLSSFSVMSAALAGLHSNPVSPSTTVSRRPGASVVMMGRAIAEPGWALPRPQGFDRVVAQAGDRVAELHETSWRALDITTCQRAITIAEISLPSESRRSRRRFLRFPVRGVNRHPELSTLTCDLQMPRREKARRVCIAAGLGA